MEKLNLDYSLKNIPIPGKIPYMKKLLEKVESFIRRIRWKAFFFENQIASGEEFESFGFKSNKSPPQMEHLKPFESDLYDIVSRIEFSHRPNDFQRKLKRDANEIRKSPEVYVAADKTTNLYKVSTDTYKKLLRDNVTKEYRLADEKTKKEIDMEAKGIASRLELSERMEALAPRDAYITLKDHKDDFQANPKCRLINPSKGELGIVSRKKLQEINAQMREASKLMQWRNTSDVIGWFKSLRRRGNKFFKFDIVEFYPSISEDLFNKSIEHAKTIVPIPKEDEEIIRHSRRSLLFTTGKVWIKRNDPGFDVTMGSYDGAEVCELVGLFLLSKLTKRFSKSNIGLYRDDGLAAQKMSGPEADRARKDLHKIFNDQGLKITVQMNLEQTDFLDVTLDMKTGRFYPYRKPDDKPLYISSKSNHPPAVMKHVPDGINARLSTISSSQEEFERCKPMYEEALRKSGFDSTLQFNHDNKLKSRARRRQVIWFNPPFSANVKTCLARQTLKLVDKHFPRHHRYSKIFNRKSVKVSYCCMDSMARIIQSHNARVLNPFPTAPESSCNCRDPTSCPLDGNCLTSCIVYKASVSVPDRPTKEYYGLTEGTFKTRFTAHKRSFRVEAHKQETELSKYIWALKNEGINDPSVTWSIVRRAAPYKCGSRRCDVCLSEKLVIALSNPCNTLNSRAEIISTCRHRRKFRLSELKV